ncbi:MAG: Glu/Leu/Phe/Val dehydrogenase [Candidatus Colwellbacteria bacterium]|nr:Glu/Leu/Phe/Val dehydrogenase [Candidatus Colwellbacteria bacterium]
MELTLKTDKFGPKYVLRVSDPKIGMEGFLVIDNLALGRGKGGIRMTSNVTEVEVFRLARTMTWKNALAEIPFGGAKAGIVWRGGDDNLKKKFVQSFAHALKPFLVKYYIAGPDVNTGEREMQWFVEAVDNYHAATGKPANLCLETFVGANGKVRHAEGARGKCGLPHEYGSTGFGVAKSTDVAVEFAGISLKGATVAIHGFGNVGTFAYQYLMDGGAKIVALADHHAALYNKDGLDGKVLNKIISDKSKLDVYPKEFRIKSEDFWKIPVDILIPASVTDVINDSNKNDIKVKIIIEGGNIPMSEEIELGLHKKGILVVPDFVANAGGVISSYAEHRGYNPKRMFDLVERKIKKSTKLVLKRAKKENKSPREVAMQIAMERVEKASQE